jgi:hypothetical protein
MKLNTVNVVEIIEGTVRAIHSFTDDVDGNKSAQDLFLRLCQENEVPPDENIDAAIEAGQITNGYWELVLIHSEL